MLSALFFSQGSYILPFSGFSLFLYCNSFYIAYSAAGCINTVIFLLTARREASRKMEKGRSEKVALCGYF